MPEPTRVPDPADSLAPTPSQANAYKWRNVQILGGGFVSGVIFSKTEPGLVYARTDIGGAYRYEAKTQTWVPILDWLSRDDANYMGVESLALDPTDPNVVYIAGGTYTKDWAGAAAMLRSNDRGKTWKVTPVSFKMGGNEYGRSNGERLAVDPNSPKVLFFGSRKNGLWKSEDGSQTWNKIDFPAFQDNEALGIFFVLIDAKSGTKGKPSQTIYAGVGSLQGPNLFVSTDGGKSFQALSGGPEKMMPHHAELDAAGTLYVTYGNNPGPNDVTNGAVYAYDPKSRRFSDITPLKPNGADVFGYSGLGVDAKRPGTLLVSTLDRWAMKDELFRTTDAGKTWKKLSPQAKWDVNGAQYLYWGREEPLHTPHWIGDVDIDPFNPNRATFVTGAGIWSTENLGDGDRDKPTKWRFTNKGLEETAVGILLSPPTGAPLFSGVGDICGFKHDDLDAPPPQGFYKNPTCNGTTGIDFAEASPDFMARVGRVWGNERHGAFSTDAGKTWSPFGSEPKSAAQGGLIAVSADAKVLLWASKRDVPHYSLDRGASWQPVNGIREGLPLPDWANFDLQPASDRVNPNTFYIYDAHKGAVYVSRDAGKNFVRTFGGLPEMADYQLNMASIQTVPGFEGHIWLSTGKRVFRSKDSGVTFSELGSADESYGIGVGKPAPGRSYPSLFLSGKVGDKKGFFRSDDIGNSFVRINDDQHQFGFVNIVEGDPRVHGRVYLGTSGRGVMVGEP
ncbi:MAG: carbohydrate-binding protein [Myxococcota bacterium]